MNIKISNVSWDTDGEDVELPTEMTVNIAEIYPNMADDISEWLSERYGFCHSGFRYDFE